MRKTAWLREMDCIGQVKTPAQHELSDRPNTRETRYTLSIENEANGHCRELLQAPMFINDAGAMMNGYFLNDSQLRNQGYWAHTLSLKVMTAYLRFNIPPKKIRLIAKVDKVSDVPCRYLKHGFRPTDLRRLSGRFQDPTIHDLDPDYDKEYVLHPAHLQQHVMRALNFLELQYVIIPDAASRSFLPVRLYHDVEMAHPYFLKELRKMASCRIHQGLSAGCQFLQMDSGGPTRRKKKKRTGKLVKA